ncbi:hypothetical protein C8R44DRAFT_750293 [Mycena epipterygia]|nr:hypothetical protein C8R44DRAFT_750293 [Mycena epipterygia]
MSDVCIHLYATGTKRCPANISLRQSAWNGPNPVKAGYVQSKLPHNALDRCYPWADAPVQRHTALPEDTAITAGCSSQATRLKGGHPASIQPSPVSRSSIAHIGADVHVIAASSTSPPKPPRSRRRRPARLQRSSGLVDRNYGSVVLVMGAQVKQNVGGKVPKYRRRVE